MADGLILAAPASGSGKTILTLGLLAALRRRGIAVASAKTGPDYIDPRFHEAATGLPCVNLDPWAMRPGLIAQLTKTDARLLLIEGVMGLFDGPDGAPGSTADLALSLSLPVILVVDASHQAQSIAALVHGFATFQPGLTIAGVILNRVASARHEDLLRRALAPLPVLGALPRSDGLALPSRHLGLVQAGEMPERDAFLARAADAVDQHCDLDSIIAAARPVEKRGSAKPLPPLAQTIAIAEDDAFAFLYPHITRGWREAGAELRFFSPLADDPVPQADAIYLPGGYPELHAARLAASQNFLPGIRAAAERGALIYGECGGYMVLGDALIDGSGARHAMAGLLPVTTSFATRRLHLGYRRLIRADAPLPWPETLRGHEFHFSTIATQAEADPLFSASDAAGRDAGLMGQRIGRVMGSYAHVIDAEDANS